MRNIEFIKKYVKKKLDKEPTGHDYLHAERVANNAIKLTNNLDVNKDIILACCYVHDLIDDKLDDEFKSSKKVVKDTLVLAGFDIDDIEHIFYIIENMSFRKGKVLDSLEGQIVQDADRLDALGAIGIARTFAFGGKHQRSIYSLDKNDKENSIAHFYDKLLKLQDLMNTKPGKEEAIKRTKYMEEFLDKFFKEVNGE